MNERIVKLETAAEYLGKAIAELTQDVRALRKEQADDFKGVRKELADQFIAVRKDFSTEFTAVRKDQSSDFRALMIAGGLAALALLGVIAKGFHWIG
jgi:gas vesicle protein